MAPNTAPTSAVVVCPLEFERQALVRAGLEASCELNCCGPGAEAITRWLARRAEEEGSGERKPVILAGVAGALDAAHPAGSAWVIERLIGADGREWQPSFTGRVTAPKDRTAVITSVMSLLTTPQAKRSAAESTRAALVDLESAAFAEAATRANWPWAIVRGVSDGADMKLPPTVEQWVDEAGRSRMSRVLGSLALRPWSLRGLMHLRANSRAAMDGVAELIRRMISEG